jgi:hypothetical protein
MRRQGVALLAVVPVAMVMAGCDLLQTRDPEQPSTSGSTFVPPTSADIVISNLQAAVREKNKENYLRCLVDTAFSSRAFQFQPTSESAARYAGVFSNWTEASEDQYFRNLAESRPGGVANLFFFNPVVTQQPPDEVIYEARYHLIFQHQSSSIPQEGRGILQLSLVRDQRSTWSIYRWIDSRDTSATTWSDFKGSFR